MKKLLMGSISLLLFSVSVLIFQISCQKDLTAQTSSSNYILPPATTSTLGGVIIGNGLSVNGNGTLSVSGSSSSLNKIAYGVLENGNTAFCTANADGTSQTSAHVTMPAGFAIADPFSAPMLSPDGTKFIFVGVEIASQIRSIWSSNIDGTNPAILIAPTVADDIYLGGTY